MTARFVFTVETPEGITAADYDQQVERLGEVAYAEPVVGGIRVTLPVVGRGSTGLARVTATKALALSELCEPYGWSMPDPSTWTARGAR